MFEGLTEALKKPFITLEKPLENPSNTTDDLHITKSLTTDEFEGVMVFNDLESYEWGYDGEEASAIYYQNKVISMYRTLAKDSDVNYAIDLIINEMAWVVDDDEFKIGIDDENNEITKTISDVFDKILKLLNITQNIHTLCRQMYTDGQANIVLTYDKNDLTSGIKKAKLIEPFNLYFDIDNNHWKFAPEENMSYNSCLYDNQHELGYDEVYSTDELVHVDYGLTSKVTLNQSDRQRINLGYLENAFKAANQLNTLENMLVPMRYSRSVSRRMFNIDVADLPPKKAKELMDKIRNEFKYKKTYDTETGTIKNMQATQPLVEDYWMSNRSGSRGTTVDTMDEKGSLMDMEDIIFSTKKLFTSMKIPTNRNPYADENGGDFSYDSTDTSNEDMGFYLHIDRLRLPVLKLLKEILKKEIIVTGVMSQQEWDKFQDKIKITFTSNSIFLDNMKKDMFIKGLDNFEAIKDHIGVTVSLETAVSLTLGWTNEQLKEEMEKIKGETNNSLYNSFYSSMDDGF